MFLSPQLQLHLLPESDLQTLEELKLRKLINEDFSNADVNAYALREEYEKYESISSQDAMTHAYDSGNRIVPESIVSSAVRAVKHSKERYFCVRQIAASQYGVNGAISTVIGSTSSAACDIAISPFTGRVEQLKMDANLDMAFSDASSNRNCSVPPPLRLTKNITNFLGHLRIAGTLQTSLGATLRALKDNKDIIEVLLLLYIWFYALQSFLFHHILSLVEHQGRMTEPSVKFRTVQVCCLLYRSLVLMHCRTM